MRRSLLPAILLIVVATPLAAWPRTSAPAGHHTPGDPWERANREIYAFNALLDRALIRPLSKLTSGLTPGPIGKVIKNFMVNLNEPVVIVNDLLQARPAPAFRSAFRLLINTTAGGLGAIDVAKALGDPMHVNGFGDTLGRWGVHSGPYIIIPVFGPSSVRDLFGMLVDDATLPIQSVNYPYRTEVDVTVAFVGGLNQREDVAKDLDTLLDGAADPYATLRSSYLQAREAQIRGDKALPPLPDIETDPTTPPTLPTPDSTAVPDSPVAVPPMTPEPAAPPPSISVHQPQALQSLPDQQSRYADDEIPCALQQGDSQGEFRPQAEERTQEGVGGFLNADSHRRHEGGAADRTNKALYGQYSSEVDLDAGHAQGQPYAHRAGDPGRQVDGDGRGDPDGMRIEVIDRLNDQVCCRRGARQEPGDQTLDQSSTPSLQADERGRAKGGEQQADQGRADQGVAAEVRPGAHKQQSDAEAGEAQLGQQFCGDIDDGG